MILPQWYIDITNQEIPVKFIEFENISCYCCKKYLPENTNYYHYADYHYLYPSSFCLKCVSDDLKEFYEDDELNNDRYNWAKCILCYKPSCLCQDPVNGVQFVKDNYKILNTNKYKSYYITRHYDDLVNIEKPKVLTPVNQLSNVFKNTYVQINIDFLLGANIDDSSLLDLVSITFYDFYNGSFFYFAGCFFINANPESKDYKRIAIYIMNLDYASILFYIDDDIDTFTYNYQEYMKNKSCTKWYLDPGVKELYQDDEILVDKLDDTLEKDGYIDYAIYYIVSHKLSYDFSNK